MKHEKPDIIHSHVNSLQYTIFPQVFMAKGVHTVHNEAHLEASGRLEVGLRKLHLSIISYRQSQFLRNRMIALKLFMEEMPF